MRQTRLIKTRLSRPPKAAFASSLPRAGSRESICPREVVAKLAKTFTRSELEDIATEILDGGVA